MTVKTVGFYNWRYPYGGGEVVTHHLARFFRSRGIRVVLYTQELDESLLTDEDRTLFEFRVLPCNDKPTLPENVRFLTESLTGDKVDCLVVQGVPGFPFAELHRSVPACKQIFCLHNKPMWELALLRKRKSTEIVNPTLVRRIEYLLLRKPFYRFTNKLERRVAGTYTALLPHVDRVLLLCPQYRIDFERDIRRSGLAGSNAPSEKYGAILNPMLPVEADPAASKQKMVLYAGRLVKVHKRVDRLLQIWKRIERQGFTDWKLVIAGTGEEEENLRETALQLGLKNVEFAGYQTDMVPLYRQAAFLCLTSNFEGLPMSLMEGQQYGVIPVSFDSYAGIDEITGNGECGIVVPSFDIRKYARLLGDAMADTTLQERMRERCYVAAEKYDLGKIGAQWLRLFDEL